MSFGEWNKLSKIDDDWRKSNEFIIKLTAGNAAWNLWWLYFYIINPPKKLSGDMKSEI